eukprot:5251318-Pyramimonas_sp.AAC.1
MALAGALPFLNEIDVRAEVDRNVEKQCVVEEFGKSARADVSALLGETIVFSFLIRDVGLVENRVCFEGFRHALAAAARVCPA